jgi:adenosylcobinamide kinase/adenosylcobinamide-phosphate guanylyltransferase
MRLRPGITLVLGGSGSGKSEFAERLAPEYCSDGVLYIATAEAGDPEMASRITLHKARRPAEWHTWEGDIKSLPSEIANLAPVGGVLLLDSLTTYLSGVFVDVPESSLGDERIWPETEKKILEGVRGIFSGFIEAAAGTNKRLVAVSDEVGCGIVPPYPMGRRFRDLQGKANQIAARYADDVALVVAGIPLWVKRNDETHLD